MKYSYQKAGNEETAYIEAPTWQEAIKLAPDRAKTSGVQLVPEQTNTPPARPIIDTTKSYSSGDMSPEAVAWRTANGGGSSNLLGRKKTATYDANGSVSGYTLDDGTKIDVNGNPLDMSINVAKGTPGRDIFDVQAYKDDLEKQKAALLTDKETQRQALINAINNKYTGINSGINETGAAEKARARTINLRSGLIDSAPGNSNLNETDKKIQAAKDASAAAQADEIQAAMSALDDKYYKRQTDLTANKLDELKGLGDVKAASLAEQTARKAPVTNILQSLANKGITYEQFKLDPSYNNVKDDFNDQELQSLFVTNAPKSSFLSDKPEILGNQAVWFQKQADGTVKPIKVDLGTNADNIKDVIKTDNGIYIINKDGTHSLIGVGSGTTAPKAFVFSNTQVGKLQSGGLSPVDIQNIQNDLKVHSLDAVLGNIKDPNQQALVKSIVAGDAAGAGALDSALGN